MRFWGVKKGNLGEMGKKKVPKNGEKSAKMRKKMAKNGEKFAKVRKNTQKFALFVRVFMSLLDSGLSILNA
jgi:hypothetical protein